MLLCAKLEGGGERQTANKWMRNGALVVRQMEVMLRQQFNCIFYLKNPVLFAENVRETKKNLNYIRAVNLINFN